MRNIKSKLFAAGATLALASVAVIANPSEASATEYNASTWTPRSVEEIQQDIEKQDDESSKYTFQWGDTLSGIALATDISLDALTEINDINNANVIFAGNSISLSADHSVVTVENEESVTSYDISEPEEVVEVEPPAESTEEEPAEEPVEEAAEEPAEQPAASESTETEENTQAQSGRTVTVEATAYSTNQPELSSTTATGINLHENPNVIAVDPSVIPLGSTVYIPGYGTYIAGDTGGAIQGNRIDIHITDLNQAVQFGRKTLEVQILD